MGKGQKRKRGKAEKKGSQRRSFKTARNLPEANWYLKGMGDETDLADYMRLIVKDDSTSGSSIRRQSDRELYNSYKITRIGKSERRTVEGKLC
eukprot:1395250-Amorphochlora_amoeboformis.AAC.1